MVQCLEQDLKDAFGEAPRQVMLTIPGATSSKAATT